MAIVLNAQDIASLKYARDLPTVLARSDNRIYVLDGWNSVAGDPSRNTLELVDPKGSVTALAPRPEIDGQSSIPYSTLLSRDRILSCQGKNCVVYEPSTDEWRQVTVPGAVNPMVALQDGTVLRAGGIDGFSTNQTFLVNPETFLASPGGNMNDTRNNDAIVRLSDGRVLAAGGNHFTHTGAHFLFDGEVFDPVTRTWTIVPGFPSPSIPLVALKDGRALGWFGSFVIYDPAANNWNVDATKAGLVGSAAALLRDGRVLITGGSNGEASASTALYNPGTKSLRQGIPLATPRYAHGMTSTSDGTLLAVSGRTTGGAMTKSIEQVFLEPQFSIDLNPGFYVASATENRGQNDGLWSLQVNSPASIDGNVFFGGLLSANGADVGFGAVALALPQTVRASIDVVPLAGARNADFQLRILDANRSQIAGPFSANGSLTVNQALPSGFFIFEIRTGPNTQISSFKANLTAGQFAGGASVGGAISDSAGVPGYLAFSISSAQTVAMRLYNETTFGSLRGASEVVLSLYDSAGRVIDQMGPGIPRAR